MSFIYNPLSGQFDIVGQGGAGVVQSFTDTVPAFSSKVVEQVAMSSLNASDYSFTLTTSTGTRFFKLTVTNNGGILRDQLFSRSGGLVLAVDVEENLGFMQITIVNGEAENMDVSFTRILN